MQNIYIREVQKRDGKLVNVDIGQVDMVKDPWKIDNPPRALGGAQHVMAGLVPAIHVFVIRAAGMLPQAQHDGGEPNRPAEVAITRRRGTAMKKWLAGLSAVGALVIQSVARSRCDQGWPHR